MTTELNKSSCGCEGSCPSCRLGEVEDHQCNLCGYIFCPNCHGVKKDTAISKIFPNIEPCSCASDELTEADFRE